MKAWKSALAAVAAAILATGAAIAAPAPTPPVVQSLMDREMIRELMARYQWALDNGDAEAYAGLFTEDAVLVSAGRETRGKPAIVQEIRDLAKRFEAAAGQPGRPPAKVQHVFTNVVITLEGDRANAKSYWTEVWNLRGGVPEVGAAGHYNDQLVRRSGQWLFSRREIAGDMAQPRAAPPAAAKPPS